MRDRRRVEAIGNSTEVIEVIVIEELKWKFVLTFLDVKGVEAAIGRKRKG